MLRLPIALALTLVFACGSSPGNGTAPDGNTSRCGDGVCDVSEVHSCPADCGSGGGGGAVCGNGICETGESSTSCPSDCTVAMCGNGVCENGETSSNCPQDCGGGMQTFSCTDPDTQGDCMFCFEDDFLGGLGSCDDEGDAFPGTANDCAMCAANGTFGTACESTCTGGETDACAQCEYIQSECGDGFCEFMDGENATNCPMDCVALVCGDHICDAQGGETSTSCAADCLLTDSFDCSDATNQNNCENCFFDDAPIFGGTVGDCTVADVPGGSPNDCAKCASIKAFGPDCVTSCTSVETGTCASCVADDF